MLTVRTALAGLALIPCLAGGSALVVGSSTSRQPLRIETLQDTLEDLERKSWVAWQGHDAKYFEQFLSEDHIEMGGFGPSTKAVVVSGVVGGGCVVKSYEVDHFKATRFDAHTAVLTYHAAQDTRCGGSPVPSPVWATSVYVLRDGRWQNAVYGQTPDLRKPGK